MRAAPLVLGLLLVARAVAGQGLAETLAREAQTHYQAGLTLMASESWEAAAAKFEAAIAVDKLMAMAHYNLGQCRMLQRRYDEAANAYVGAREAFKSVGLLSQQERSERERLRRDEINELRDLLRDSAAPSPKTIAMQERLRVLESAQNRDLAGDRSVPAEVYLALGSAYFRQQKLEDAEREYREAVRVNSKLGAAHNNLAVIYLLTGRLDQAEESMKQAERNDFKVHPQFKADLKAARQKK
jgi:tetratricopeptide (TPR) repeat protein